MNIADGLVRELQVGREGLQRSVEKQKQETENNGCMGEPGDARDKGSSECLGMPMPMPACLSVCPGPALALALWASNKAWPGVIRIGSQVVMGEGEREDG